MTRSLTKLVKIGNQRNKHWDYATKLIGMFEYFEIFKGKSSINRMSAFPFLQHFRRKVQWMGNFLR